MQKEKLNLTPVISTWRDRINGSGKSLSSVAKEIGISKGQLSQYLSGINTPSVKIFERIENGLRGIGL